MSKTWSLIVAMPLPIALQISLFLEGLGSSDTKQSEYYLSCPQGSISINAEWEGVGGHG